MRVGIDCRPLFYGPSGGIVQWLSGIFSCYATSFPEDELVIFRPDDFPPGIMAGPAAREIAAPREELGEAEAAFLRQHGVDALVRTYPTHDHPDFPLQRQIAFIPDMQHAEMPQFFAPEALRARRLGFGPLLAEAGAIGTMTAFARDAILRDPWTTCRDVFLAPPSVSFAPPGQDEEETGDPAWAGALDDLAGYFLMPANMWPHKNHARLFEAFALASRALPRDFALILTGAPPEGAELLSGFEHLPIRHLGYVDRRHMPFLYRRATALTFFSLYEGFGMPLLEAFDCGTPVVCSDIPALSEVGGDAVLGCSPYDVEAMAGLMVRVATDGELRRDLVAKGSRRLSHYSWQNSATAVREAVQRVRDRAAAGTPAASFADGRRPKLSIVVEVPRDARRAITIGSLLRQTYRPREIVVVGATPAPWLRWLQPRLVRYAEAARGTPAERAAAALQALDGEVILYLLDDCQLAANALERIADHFTRRRGCDILVCPLIKRGRRKPTTSPLEADMRRPGAAGSVFEDHILQRMHARAAREPLVVAWRRRLHALVEPPTDAAAPFDLALWLRLVRAGGTVELLDQPIAADVMPSDPRRARRWRRPTRRAAAHLMARLQGSRSSR